MKKDNEKERARNAIYRIVSRMMEWEFIDWLMFIIQVGIVVSVAKMMIFGFN